ncbi:MAG: M2 family metallopeptidase [Rhodothermales bacterium]|nr:M2 family metallopeptidase [Rhodothermales bacterium]
MTTRLMLPMALAAILLASCSTPDAFSPEAQEFLDAYTTTYKALGYESAEAEWALNTRIVPGDTTASARANAANEAYAAFTGSVENIETAREWLSRADELSDLQTRQFEQILYVAANSPQTVPDVVTDRIALETELTERLFGFDFQMDGRSVTPNEIDRVLRESDDLEARLAAWNASKEVGRTLKEGVADVRHLRNQTVQALGYDDYFAYQVSDYGMTSDEMSTLMDQVMEDLYPLYREIHTWARYHLAERYGADVPDLLPAHWLPNRWAQDWGSLVTVEGADIGSALESWTAEDIVRRSEEFYVSMGFGEMPETFWDKSSLYPLPADAPYRKNNHASAWHMDLEDDVRSLMSVENDPGWYETSHHELGHIYYYMSYTNPDVPPLLRGGANRGFHEAVGSLLGLAALQPPFLQEVGLLPADAPEPGVEALLKEALNYVVFIPFSAGTMMQFERDLYAEELPADEFNARWWQYAEEYQGVVPPSPRDGDLADATTKTHIVNDAAQYYDYAVSQLILFQLHDHIARNILGQDPHATNYYGSTEVGDFLKTVLTPGATVDWRELLQETTGGGLSAGPMVAYFEPLMAYLQEVNQGRTYTLPEPGM